MGIMMVAMVFIFANLVSVILFVCWSAMLHVLMLLACTCPSTSSFVCACLYQCPVLLTHHFSLLDATSCDRRCVPKQLLTYLEDAQKSAVDTGDIAGVLLTGLETEAGTTLLTNYIQDTGDIQTACLSNVLGVGRETSRQWLDTFVSFSLFL